MRACENEALTVRSAHSQDHHTGLFVVVPAVASQSECAAWTHGNVSGHGVSSFNTFEFWSGERIENGLHEVLEVVGLHNLGHLLSQACQKIRNENYRGCSKDDNKNSCNSLHTPDVPGSWPG